MQTVLELRNVARAFAQGGDQARHTQGRSTWRVRPGEIVALVGPSGAGKSTLLHIAGLLEAPDAGEVFIAGRNCSTLDDADAHPHPPARHRLRLSVPSSAAGILGAGKRDDAAAHRRRGQEGGGRARHVAAAASRPRVERSTTARRELSGGEQQRVAIARALANRPLLLLADEPTGNLDPRTAGHVHAEFLRLIEEEGLGAVIATHNLELAQRMHRILHLDKGLLVEVGV